MRARSADGKLYPARIVDVDDVNDLAILRLDGAPSLKPLALGDDSQLSAEQRVTAMGHPEATAVAYASPGYVEGRLNFGLPGTKGKEDYSWLFSRNLIATRLHTRGGNSGGPLLHENGEVVGVCSSGDSSYARTFFTPASKLESMLQLDTPKFTAEYTYAGAEWTRHKPLEAGVLSLSAGMGVESLLRMPTLPERIGIYRMEVKPLGYRLTQQLNIGLGLYGLASLNSDARALYHSTNSRDSLKYGAASLGDTGMVSGALIRHAAMDGAMAVKFRTGKVGVALLAAGVAVKLASDLIPNRLVQTNLGDTNGELRPGSRK